MNNRSGSKNHFEKISGGRDVIITINEARADALTNGGYEQFRTAAVNAVAETLLEDKLAAFEAEFFVHRLARFIEDNPGFADSIFKTSGKLDLRALPSQLEEWIAENADIVELEEAKVTVGATLYLIAKFEPALELLSEVAVDTRDPTIALLAADAALPISQPSVALKFLEMARWQMEPDNDADTRRFALLLAKIGACHEMLIDDTEHVISVRGELRSRAVDAYEEALSLLPTRRAGFVISESDRLDLLARARVLNNLGYTLMSASGTEHGQNAERERASAFMKEALEIRTKLRDIGPNLARVHLNLAEIDRLIGNVAGIYDHIAAADAALLDSKETGFPHPIQAKLESLRAGQMWEESKFFEAEQGFEKALKLLQACGLGESEDALLVRYSIAHTLIRAEKPGGRRYLLELYQRVSDRLKQHDEGFGEKKTSMLMEMLREDITKFPASPAQ